MTISIKIQNVQTGLLSSDKLFQSQHQLPELHKRLFEAEVQKQMQTIQEQTQRLRETEQAHIDEKNKQQEGGKSSGNQQKGDNSQREEDGKNFIEKGQNGKIKHLDVKI